MYTTAIKEFIKKQLHRTKMTCRIYSASILFGIQEVKVKATARNQNSTCGSGGSNGGGGSGGGSGSGNGGNGGNGGGGSGGVGNNGGGGERCSQNSRNLGLLGQYLAIQKGMSLLQYSL